jgi:xanthosine utilization system XapX-like protein
MDGGVKEPLPPALGVLAVAGILGDVGEQAGIENALAIVRGVKATSAVEIRTSQSHPDLFGHLLQRFQARREQDQVCLIDRRHGDRRYDIALGVRDGDDLLPLLMFVPRVANAIPPFLATVLVPSPCSTLTSRCCSAARCRTLARNACQSDPSSAHFAKARETVVEGRAGVPLAPFGSGRHFHCIPV